MPLKRGRQRVLHLPSTSLPKGQVFSAGKAMPPVPGTLQPVLPLFGAVETSEHHFSWMAVPCKILSLLPHTSARHLPGAPLDGVLPLFIFLKSRKLHPYYYEQRTRTLRGLKGSECP